MYAYMVGRFYRFSLVYLPIKAPTHEQNNEFEEYKHNKTYLQGTGNTSNYSVMCWGRYDTS